MLQFILRPHNLEVERDDVKDKISQIKSVFDSEIRHLSLISMDWAVWDDTYKFVQDKNQDYILSNFPEDLLDDMELNRVEIFDRSGKSVFCRVDTELDMSPLMHDTTTLKKEFLLSDMQNHSEQKQGIMSLGGTVAFVSISSILPGDRNAPSTGVIMMIRIVDQDIIENIEKSTHADISLLSIEDLSLDQNAKDNEFLIDIIDDENLVSYGYLRGLDDKISIAVEVGLKREFVIQSEELILFLFIFVSILGFISLVASLYLMRKSISQPLSKLVEYISNIRNDDNYKKCELNKREDEIGLLAKEFSLLLNKLSKTNEALLKAARIDTLTGLPNRLDMEEKFQRIKDISAREGKEFSILMLDIDYFKNYNDTYGHVKGDEVLTRIAHEMDKSSMRPGDYFARYGGEEFIALLENTGKNGAIEVAKRILKNIENLHLEHQSSLVTKKIITISIGCLSVVAQKDDTQEYLINMADEALYRAKEKGRDQYYVYERTQG
ncbi:diguanylate cyclase [Campylobacterota bacterium]